MPAIVHRGLETETGDRATPRVVPGPAWGSCPRVHHTGPTLVALALLLVLMLAHHSPHLALAQSPAGDSALDASSKHGSLDLLVGTYTWGKSQGIYRLELDLATGQLAQKGLVVAASQPSFLAVHPTRPGVFASVHETDEHLGRPGGGISLYQFDPTTGTANLLQTRATHGGAPCHIAINGDGRNLGVANYMGGNYTFFGVQAATPQSESTEDGASTPIGAGLNAGALFQNKGSSVNSQRQEAPHGHCVRYLPGESDRVIVADLGTDEVLVFQLKLIADEFVPRLVNRLEMPPGSGPRQIDFHPNGRWIYVINELTSTVSLIDFTPDSGEMNLMQTITTLPENFTGNNSTAHIQVHPSGQFVYGSNRGHDSIACFSVDSETGFLSPIGHQASGGQAPRHFLIEPTGHYLLAANQGSDNVLVFPIDQGTGQLGQSQFQAMVPTPVCLAVLPSGDEK